MKIPKPYQWRGAWYIKIVKPDGKRTQKKFADTKEKAMAKWRKLCQQADLKTEDNEDTDVTLNAVVRAFAKEQKRRLEQGTLSAEAHRWRLLRLSRAMADPKLSSVTIGHLKPFMVSEWLDNEKTWGPTTRSDAVATLKQAIKWAKQQGMIAKHPLEDMSEQRGSPREFTISDELFDQLLDGIGSQKRSRSFGVMLKMILWTGTRPSELCRVNVDDYRPGPFEDGAQLPGSLYIREHKNKKRTRKARVVILSQCADSLARMAIGQRKSGPIFRPSEGSRWEYSTMRRRFDRLRAKVEAPKACVLYSLRHTRITNDMLDGMEAAIVATIHGTSLEMIERVYGHLSHHRTDLLQAKAAATIRRGQRKFKNAS